MTKVEEYISRYKDYAIEQMQKYGIPASVTLAQGILESGRGTSNLAITSNNHFGIKASDSWIKNGGEYVVAKDDRPDDRFCKYESVADSYEHHSRILADSSRYSKCFSLAKDDYIGWCRELSAAGYASDKDYAAKLRSIIEGNHLEDIDRTVMLQMPQISSRPENSRVIFPLTGDSDIIVKDVFGEKKDGEMSEGMEIFSAGRTLLVAEDGAHITSVKAGAGGRQSVTIEYGDQDMRIVYSGLESVSVKEGDVLSAGDTVARCGSNLVMTVSVRTSSGQWRDIDPVNWLSEINSNSAEKKNMYYNGENLLMKTDSSQSLSPEGPLSRDEWFRKLLSSEDCGLDVGSADNLLGTLVSLFLSMMLMADQIDNERKIESRETEAVLSRRIDLSSFMPGMQKSEILIKSDGTPVVNMSNGKTVVSRELTEEEQSRLSLILSNKEMSPDGKRQAISDYFGSIMIQHDLSSRFEQSLSSGQAASETLKR